MLRYCDDFVSENFLENSKRSAIHRAELEHGDERRLTGLQNELQISQTDQDRAWAGRQSVEEVAIVSDWRTRRVTEC